MLYIDVILTLYDCLGILMMLICCLLCCAVLLNTGLIFRLVGQDAFVAR